MSVIEERLVALWQSEEILTGAVKEVKEETGIDTEFMELIAFSTLETRRTQLREWEIASESLEHFFFLYIDFIWASSLICILVST